MSDWLGAARDWVRLRSIPKRAEAGDKLIYRDDEDSLLSSSWRGFVVNTVMHVLELGLVLGVIFALLVVAFYVV